MRSWEERGFSYKDEETKLEGQGVEKQDKGFDGIVYQNVSLRDQPARRRGCVLPSPRVVHMCVGSNDRRNANRSLANKQFSFSVGQRYKQFHPLFIRARERIC